MAPKGKHRGVSYYFRIEFSTLQGKITSGFCMVGILASVLVVLASRILIPALDQSQYIVHVLDPSERHLLIMSAQVDQIVAKTNAHLLGNTTISDEEIKKNRSLLQASLDSLKPYAKQWTNSDASLSLKVAEVKAESLIKKLKEIKAAGSSEDQAQLMLQGLIPLQQTIQSQLQKIQQIHAAEKNIIQAFITRRTGNLTWILVSCLALCTLVGGSFAAYILIQVLREIRMLKGKILELSEGKLISPIPASRNELNSIIKAINALLENLGNIRHFAQEVGKGNFDTNISVFEGQNDLGESLAGMRDSLKMVALEEKQRNWVTTGLAHFSELLRTSSDDLTTYYQTIISELAKTLQVNQAAIYVLNDADEKKPVLEMKSSYAYGRLKYLEKTIIPGQGMAGQVFLEKMPVFLKNIPQNFLQISSGLGEGTARFLAVVPLKVNDTVNGVLELASFHELAPHELEFLSKIAEDISGAIQNVNNIQTTARLLEEAQSMAQAMQSQEEMLRQNSEELIATQEQLNRDLQDTQQRLSLLENVIDRFDD